MDKAETGTGKIFSGKIYVFSENGPRQSSEGEADMCAGDCR